MEKQAELSQDGAQEEKEQAELSQDSAQEEKKQKKEGKNMPFLLQLAGLVVLVLLLRTFVLGTVYVKGSSMEPNFHHGDLVFINKLSTNIGSPKRGDVVICRLHGDGTEENLIKRVIGLPGDEIELVVREDYEDYVEYDLYRNGEYVEEDFILEPIMNKGNIEYPYIVPEGSYFVMGDNRNGSTDSRKRTIGAIPKADLVGKVVFRLYPFDDFGLID